MSERVAIYCRLSEEDRHKQNNAEYSGSIQNQKAMLNEYAKKMGWNIYDVYVDEDYAGADRSRPSFLRLLRDAEARRFDIVLCKTQSRFTRELELVERYIHGLFPLWGIRFVSIVDNADTDNKGNKKSRQINGLVNEWYLEDMSESIKSALDIRRQNGYHIGSFALYGYKKDPDVKGHLLVDEEAANVVREVFTRFSRGEGKTAIARELNRRGIPNPTEYKRLQGLRFKMPSDTNSTLWRYSSISDMLTNEMYIGNMVQGKYGSVSYKLSLNRPRPKEKWYVVEGTHEPIIERKLWDRVQRMIGERAKPFVGGSVGLFSGKVRCASCGYVMRSSTSGGRKFLQCTNRHVLKDACVGAFISVDRLERIVVGELNRLSGEYLDLDDLSESVALSTSISNQKTFAERELVLCQNRINELSKAMRDLYIDKARGIISENDLIFLIKDFTEQRQKAKERFYDIKLTITELDRKAVEGNDCMETIRKYIEVEHMTRQMVEFMIEKITVSKRIEGTRHVPVEIYWRF